MVTTAVTELAEFALDVACRAGLRRTRRRCTARPLGARRPARPALGGGHGQARRARAQRVERHRPDLPLRPRRRDRGRRRRARAHRQPGVLRARRQAHLRAGGRHHRARLRVPRRPGAAAQRQFGAAAWCRSMRWKSISRCRAASGSASPGSRAAWWRRSRCVDDCSAQALRGVVLPFVFRRYLDYNVFDSLRTLHRQIREQAARRSAGRPERANDVKLSRGGIREIEFTVQLLQVVRGGQFPELRTRPTLDALQRLARANLMPQETADALAAAYEFLRRVEHRIQYLDDQQTHVLPVNDDDLRWIAAVARLCRLLPLPARSSMRTASSWRRSSTSCWAARSPARAATAAAASAAPADLSDLIDELPPAFAERIRRLVRQPARAGPARRNARAPAPAGAAHRPVAARTRQRSARADRPPRRGRAALGRLDRAAAAARELHRAAGRAARRCRSACCACWAPPSGRRAT